MEEVATSAEQIRPIDSRRDTASIRGARIELLGGSSGERMRALPARVTYALMVYTVRTADCFVVVVVRTRVNIIIIDAVIAATTCYNGAAPNRAVAHRLQWLRHQAAEGSMVGDSFGVFNQRLMATRVRGRETSGPIAKLITISIIL